MFALGTGTGTGAAALVVVVVVGIVVGVVGVFGLAIEFVLICWGCCSKLRKSKLNK